MTELTKTNAASEGLIPASSVIREGFEGVTASDLTIPFQKILQGESPEVKNPAKRVKGAQAGMWMNSVTRQLWDGETGFIFVPCARQRNVVEWLPRDTGPGGFVGIHAPTSAIVQAAVERAARTKDKFDWRTPEGNHLVDTYYLYGLVLSKPNASEEDGFAVVSFSKARIKFYKDIMFRMSTRKGPDAHLFTNQLLLTTFLDHSKKNATKTFFNTRPVFAINDDPVASALAADDVLVTKGRALSRMVNIGTATIDHAQAEADVPTASEEEAF